MGAAPLFSWEQLWGECEGASGQRGQCYGSSPDGGLFLLIPEIGPRSHHLLLGQEGGGSSPCNPVESAGFAPPGFVTWQAVKYLPCLCVSAAACVAHLHDEVSSQVLAILRVWQSCSSPGARWGGLRQRPLCLVPVGRPRREAEGGGHP